MVLIGNTRCFILKYSVLKLRSCRPLKVHSRLHTYLARYLAIGQWHTQLEGQNSIGSDSTARYCWQTSHQPSSNYPRSVEHVFTLHLMMLPRVHGRLSPLFACWVMEIFLFAKLHSPTLILGTSFPLLLETVPTPDCVSPARAVNLPPPVAIDLSVPLP